MNQLKFHRDFAFARLFIYSLLMLTLQNFIHLFCSKKEKIASNTEETPRERISSHFCDSWIKKIHPKKGKKKGNDYNAQYIPLNF